MMNEFKWYRSHELEKDLPHEIRRKGMVRIYWRKAGDLIEAVTCIVGPEKPLEVELAELARGTA